MKKKRLLLILVFLLVTAVGVGLVNPYPRQLVFGPKIQGVPLCAWQEQFRRWIAGNSEDESLLPTILSWVGPKLGREPDLAVLTDDETERVLLSLVDDSDPKVKEELASQLAVRRTPATFRGLIRLLDDSDKSVRARAAWRINSFGADAKAALPKILELLDGPDAEKRAMATEMLDRVRPRSRQTLAALVRLLDDPHADVRSTAACCLGEWHWKGRQAAKVALPRLGQLCADPYCRLDAALAIWNIDAKDEQVVPVLQAALKGSDADARYYALNRMARHAELSKSAFPILVDLARGGEDVHVRWAAIENLANCGKDAIPVLLPLLHDPAHRVQYRAACALSMIGPDAEVAAPIVFERLAKTRDPVPMPVVDGDLWYAIGGFKSAKLVPSIAAFLDTRDTSLRPDAIRALGKIGPNAREAVPKLLALATEADARTQCDAARALFQIGAEEHLLLPLFLEMVFDPDHSVQEALSDVLVSHGLGPKVKAAAPVLIAKLREGHPGSCHAILVALGHFGREAKEAVPELLKLLDDASLSNYAVTALGRIGHDSAGVVPRLIPLLQNADDQLCVTKALAGFGTEAAAAVPALIPLMEHDNLDVADAAAEALARIAPDRFPLKK